MSKGKQGTPVKKAPRLWINAAVVLAVLAVVHFTIGFPRAWEETTIGLAAAYDDLPWRADEVAAKREAEREAAHAAAVEEAYARHREANNIQYTPENAASYSFRSLEHYTMPSICADLRYVIYEPTLTPAREQMIFDAVAATEAAAGVSFEFDGYTNSDAPPEAVDLGVTNLVIGWVPPGHPRISGVAGSSVLTGYAGTFSTEAGIYLRDQPDKPAGYGTLLHELGHHLGLSHVEDSGQVMYGGGATPWRPTEFSAGDVAGFKALKEKC